MTSNERLTRPKWQVRRPNHPVYRTDKTNTKFHDRKSPTKHTSLQKNAIKCKTQVMIQRSYKCTQRPPQPEQRGVKQSLVNIK